MSLIYDNSKTNFEFHRNMSDDLQRNASKLSRWNFIMRQDNNQKQSKLNSTKDIISVKNFLDWPNESHNFTAWRCEHRNPPKIYNNWRWPLYKTGRTPQKKTSTIRSCQWITGSMLLLQTKDIQLNISRIFSYTFAFLQTGWSSTKRNKFFYVVCCCFFKYQVKNI